ncbi:OmpA family protein [Flavihumibacter petaseus]|uniref:OmpA family protein n=1 Tax=Flavihumibacter petaseus NBRC 106054 TaxID=1220578 RepID=A0A0E9MZK9_9BACT|nr:OmpA family protein [Flavihumibacter petaseus]GAO42550.1 OmpA family protein [Flavihumibacter petaseus NBRC 106054]
MKAFISLILATASVVPVLAQPLNDSLPKLVQQKDNIITANTIIKIENMGPNINSEFAELRPTISPDGTLLFFVCENHPSNTKYNSVPNSQDIWFAEKDTVTGKWMEAHHLPYPLNTVHYNAVYWVSPDNLRILIRGAFYNGAYNGRGVSMCTLQENGRFSEPEALRIKNYEKYDRGRQSGATMGQDGKTLLLYMTPEQGGAANDIFVCFLQPDRTWSEPKSLGKKINLPDFDEMTPYLSADGVTLYFSSNRPGGLGDNDIYRTRRLDNSWQKWSDPVNLGAPINTENWDAFFTLDAGGEYAYLTNSENTLGESDIVRVRLMEQEKPDPVVMLTGNVYNKKTGLPISANLVYETLPDGNVAGNGLSSPFDGAFKMVLPYDKNYSIRATADHFFAISENLNLDSLVKQGFKEIHKDLYLVPIEIGSVVRLNNVFFDFDKWALRPESFLELDRVVKLLEENPTIEIELSAHTDSHGSDEYNFKLSDNRARSVMEYILSKGIAKSRLTSQGYGEGKPIVPNDTDENRQLNRRVEFKIVKN